MAKTKVDDIANIYEHGQSAQDGSIENCKKMWCVVNGLFDMHKD